MDCVTTDSDRYDILVRWTTGDNYLLFFLDPRSRRLLVSRSGIGAVVEPKVLAATFP